MKLYKSMLNNVVIALEILYFHMNMNGLVFKLIKRKHELSKIQAKKTNFINRSNYAELKIICICVDVYKIYEGNDYDTIYENLSTLKKKKLKTNKFLIEK